MEQTQEPEAGPPVTPELPRGIALAWGVAANPQRGPKREMSVERIVETAVGLADEQGLGAVSMAAVAKRLGYTPMSLYRYVTAKDDLLLLMSEEAAGLPPEPAAVTTGEEEDSIGWRERTRELFQTQVMSYLRHPWLLSLPITGAPVTPNSSAWLDAGLAALEQTPLTEEEKISVVLLGLGQARWYGTVMAGYDEQSRATGLSAREVSEQESALFDLVITAEEYPRLRRAIDAGVFRSEEDPFQFGVERSLDGVASYIAELERGGDHVPAEEWLVPEDADVGADKKYREAAKATREAQKALREAEKTLRQARKLQRQTLKEARERVQRKG